jgi:hypothetical protein
VAKLAPHLQRLLPYLGPQTRSRGQNLTFESHWLATKALGCEHEPFSIR